MVIKDSLSIKLAEDDEDSPYLNVANRAENRKREFSISNPMCIPPICGIPEWRAEFAQFEIEAGPLDVYELDDLRVKPNYVFDKNGRVKELTEEEVLVNDREAETQWIKSLRVYYKAEGGIVGTDNAIFNQAMMQGQAAAMFTNAIPKEAAKQKTEEEKQKTATAAIPQKIPTSTAELAILQFATLGHLAEFVCSQSVIERGDIKQTRCTFLPEWIDG